MMTLEQIEKQVAAEAREKLVAQYRDAALKSARARIAERGDEVRSHRNMNFYQTEGYHAVDITMDNPQRYVVNERKAQQHGERQADAIVRNFAAKLHRKAGHVEGFTLRALTWSSWTVDGTLGDRKVHIDQSMIWNRSRLGTSFPQFPALIYVDGKKVSEKQLRAITAE